LSCLDTYVVDIELERHVLLVDTVEDLKVVHRQEVLCEMELFKVYFSLDCAKCEG